MNVKVTRAAIDKEFAKFIVNFDFENAGLEIDYYAAGGGYTINQMGHFRAPDAGFMNAGRVSAKEFLFGLQTLNYWRELETGRAATTWANEAFDRNLATTQGERERKAQ